jgi:hypothetical protein
MNEIGWSQPRIDQEMAWMAGEADDLAGRDPDPVESKMVRKGV